MAHQKLKWDAEGRRTKDGRYWIDGGPGHYYICVVPPEARPYMSAGMFGSRPSLAQARAQAQRLQKLLDMAFPNGFDASWMTDMYAAKEIGGDEWLTVIPLTFGRARLCVAESGPMGDASLEHWCMDSPQDALAAFRDWPTTPVAWNRHQLRDRSFEWPDGRIERAS